MTLAPPRSVDVPRPAPPAGGRLCSPARRARRHALDVLRAFVAIGEPYAYRVVAPDGTAVAPDQVTEQDDADVRGDLEHLGAIEPTPLDALVTMLEEASSHGDRSRVAPALDRMLSYVDSWSALSPARLAELFERLTPSRLVRAVGQTLLAATRLPGDGSPARRAFLAAFLEDLRARGTPEETIARLRRGLET
jgi:hypothetical protein